jgi:hypothetical protein
LSDLHHSVKLEGRYVSPSEFVRQGPRELKKLSCPDDRFEFVVDGDRCVVRQVVRKHVPSLIGPFQDTALAVYAAAVDSDYDYWALGASRRTEVRATGAVTKHGAVGKAEARRALEEFSGDGAERLEWALNKDTGHGIHVGGGSH